MMIQPTRRNLTLALAASQVAIEIESNIIKPVKAQHGPAVDSGLNSV
jgi:hypothetical protein